MTLIIGMRTADGVLLSADKALSMPMRIGTVRSKLKKYLESHIITGFAGSLSDIQGVENGLEELFSAYFKQNKFNVDALGKLLFSAEFKKFSEQYNFLLDFSGLIAAGEKGTSKIYHIYPLYRNNIYSWGIAEIIPREKDYHCIGSGNIAGAMLLLENFFSQNKIPTKETAVRLCALINYLISSFTTDVSSSFEVIAITEKNVLTLPTEETQKVSFEVRKLWNFTKSMTNHMFENLKFSLWLITQIFNERHKKAIRFIKNKGNIVVILDDMYKKQRKIYTLLLKHVPDAKIFEDHGEAINFIRQHTEDIRAIFVDRVVKSKQITFNFLEEMQKLMLYVPVIVVGQRFDENELNQFSEKGVSHFILKNELAQDEEKILKILQITDKRKEIKWRLVKEFK